MTSTLIYHLVAGFYINNTMSNYIDHCVNCGKSHRAYSERKSSYVCRDCRDIRDKYLRKDRKKAKKLRKKLITKYGNTCSRCGQSFDTLHLHHIIPVVSGGETTENNSLILCASCHRKVHSRHPVQWTGSKVFEFINR